MAGAAQRFYEAVDERNIELGGQLDPADEPIDRPGHRYFGVWRSLRETNPKRVLELGFGGLNLTRPVARIGQFEYHITDIVDRAKRLALPANTTLHVCDLDDDFPFATAAFDTVVAMMVVEHLYDPFHAVAEIARVLKPGGRLIMNLPNIASIRCRLQLLAGKMPVTSATNWRAWQAWDGGHLHNFTVADVRWLAAQSGLRLLGLDAVGSHRRLKALWPSMLCHEITYTFEREA